MPDSTDNLLKQIALGEDSVLDASAVPKATLDDLKAPLWRRFRSPLSPKDDREFLSKLKLITCDEEGNWFPTVSGVLMATERPADFISNAYIQAVVYRGTERNEL